MNEYVIVTDSSCDLSMDLVKQMDLEVLQLSILIGNKQYKNYADEREITFAEVYKHLRNEAAVKTAAVNVEDFTSRIGKILDRGLDVLYLGFSSALSSTYDNGVMAAKSLRESYPDRKLITVDTRSASLGEGMLVHLAFLEKQKGKTMEEVARFVEDTKFHLCHWFTVEDLHHLKRGGRVSSATAVIGSMLSIKPIMHMNNEGKLVNVGKVRGRQRSIDELFNKAKQSAVNPSQQTMFISHGDCEEDAKYLSKRLREELKVVGVIYNFVGPVIGAHSGPGTLALFFVGDKR